MVLTKKIELCFIRIPQRVAKDKLFEERANSKQNTMITNPSNYLMLQNLGLSEPSYQNHGFVGTSLGGGLL